MKKIIYITAFAILTLFTSSSFAQLRKLPAEVTTAFQEKYPNAKAVEWRDKLSSFAASFQQDSSSYIAQFSSKGEWENTEEAIDESELPEVVKEGFDKSKYADWNLEQVIRIELPDNEVQYKIATAKSDIKKRNLYFNSEGRLLKDKITL